MSTDQNLTDKVSFISSVKDVVRKAWPINWNNLKNFKLIREVLSAAAYPYKVFLLIFTSILIISIGFFGFGLYLVFTKEVSGNGGLIREAVISSAVKVFNPVLELNSPFEKQVVALLYHPLYQITYPDFATAGSEPTLTPVLLAKNPDWQDLAEIKPENRYKRLRFTLKDNIKWSDNSKITSGDVEYTFNRLKEDSGNSVFRTAFAGITYETISDTEFDLVSQKSTPKLLYSANFQPISKNFYEGLSSDKLISDARSFKPTVTSGYFVFGSGTAKDPDTNANRENPFRDPSTGLIQGVLLDRNKNQNTGENVFVDQYYLQKVSDLFDSGGNLQSVERLAKSGKVDIFQRNASSDLGVTSLDVSNKLKMSQETISTNTFLGLYLNIKLDNSSGYFINQYLRQYVICNFLNYKLDQKYSSQLEDVPKDSRLIPISLGQKLNPDCPENTDSVLDIPKSTNNSNVYTIKFDASTGIKRVLLFGEEIKLNLVGSPSSEPLLSDIQSFFLSIGLPANLISDPDLVADSLQNKTYNVAFVPVTYTSRDPYPLFGSAGQDISRISLNNRVLSYKFEENIKKYSDSNLTDEAAKKTLIDFFSKEFVSLNLFRAKQEINYTSKIINVKDNLPGLITFNEDVYIKMPYWYVSTKRQFWFQ